MFKLTYSRPNSEKKMPTKNVMEGCVARLGENRGKWLDSMKGPEPSASFTLRCRGGRKSKLTFHKLV